MKKLYELTVKEASELLQKSEISSVELTQAVLDRIDEMEPEINAFITVTDDTALTKAAQIDADRKAGKKLSKLAGIPYSLKDIFNTKGIRTTAGSKMLEDFVSEYDATVVKKLDEAGAILIGKTNCDPFGFGSSTENSAYGVTKNPIDTSRVPGGSSGGSGAAVAYGGGLFSIAGDTGGSIRCPASFCGVAGLKPTYGRVSRYGAIAYASSFDCVGPIAKTVGDLAIIMETISGQDDKDATSSDLTVPEYSSLISNTDLKGKKIGLPKEYFGEGLDPEVREVIDSAIAKYRSLGCEVKEISLPNTDYAVAAYYIIGLSEASSNLGRYDGIRYGVEVSEGEWRDRIKEARGKGFSDEEKRRIMIGTYTLSAGYADQYYKRAQKIRELLKADFLRAFEEIDVIITPTMPILPFKIGEMTADPLQMWLADAFTVSLNPVGVPGLSVKAGESKDGLPIGMQIIGKHFDEEQVLAFGQAFERA